MVRQELRSYASDTDTDHDVSGRSEVGSGLQLRQQISYLICKLKAFTIQLTAATSIPAQSSSSKSVLHGVGYEITTVRACSGETFLRRIERVEYLHPQSSIIYIIHIRLHHIIPVIPNWNRLKAIFQFLWIYRKPKMTFWLWLKVRNDLTPKEETISNGLNCAKPEEINHFVATVRDLFAWNKCGKERQ